MTFGRCSCGKCGEGQKHQHNSVTHFYCHRTVCKEWLGDSARDLNTVRKTVGNQILGYLFIEQPSVVWKQCLATNHQACYKETTYILNYICICLLGDFEKLKCVRESVPFIFRLHIFSCGSNYIKPAVYKCIVKWSTNSCTLCILSEHSCSAWPEHIWMSFTTPAIPVRKCWNGI